MSLARLRREPRRRAEARSCGVVSVGRYPLRGVAQPQELLTPEPGFILP